MPPESIVVIGLHGQGAELSKPARRALDQADVVVGGCRHLSAVAPDAARTIPIGGDLPAVLDEIEREAGHVVVLASGDPGFFGMVRPLAARFGPSHLEVHPAPSSVSLAFARIGRSWDDAFVVSAHGRPLAEAVDEVIRHPKVAVLVSPDNSAALLGRALIVAGAPCRTVAVCSRLGLDDERVTETDLVGLAAGEWEPLSVVLLLVEPGAPSEGKTLAWGRSEDAFSHRNRMVTKAEVRAVALGKLDLPAAGVLWDIGAGSGSVAIESALVRPGLSVHAVERSADDAARIVVNASSFGASVQVMVGEAPECLSELPDPDRVFVGGGGLDVLEACIARARPDGQIVATYAAIERAAEACDRLGSLTQVAVARGRRLPDGGLRLEAENPVFVVWGPRR